MWTYLTLLTLGELFAQFLLKLGTQQVYLFAVAGVIGYAIIGYVYYLSLFENKMASISVAWHVVMTIATILISMLYFKESYNTKEMIGLLLGIVSLILLGHSH